MEVKIVSKSEVCTDKCETTLEDIEHTLVKIRDMINTKCDDLETIIRQLYGDDIVKELSDSEKEAVPEGKINIILGRLEESEI